MNGLCLIADRNLFHSVSLPGLGIPPAQKSGDRFTADENSAPSQALRGTSSPKMDKSSVWESTEGPLCLARLPLPQCLGEKFN